MSEPTSCRPYWGFVNRDGAEVDWPPGCVGGDQAPSCLRAAGLTEQFVYYHPASRFWPMQFIQASVVVLLCAVLLGLAAVAVRRRLT